MPRRLSLAQGQNIVLETDADVDPIAPDAALACFRIVQEALANAVKHSGAKNLRVSLKRVDHDVTVSIRDDGVGFDVKLARARARDAGSVGLLSMGERAALAGGFFKIDSSLGLGTSVCASFSAEPAASGA
jgi:signal transduction histidine kinase